MTYMKKLNCVKLNQEKAPIPTICSIKGLDKILKKVGEEATEVVIAAKNDNQELIAEVSDLAYHLLVLLAEKKIFH